MPAGSFMRNSPNGGTPTRRLDILCPDTMRAGSVVYATGQGRMAEIAGASAIWRTLGIANYRNYMAGNFCAQLGMWVQRIAVQWLTWELTNSPTWLGIIAFADFFFSIMLAPLAGALADRLDRLFAIRLYM